LKPDVENREEEAMKEQQEGKEEPKFYHFTGIFKWLRCHSGESYQRTDAGG